MQRVKKPTLHPGVPKSAGSTPDQDGSHGSLNAYGPHAPLRRRDGERAAGLCTLKLHAPSQARAQPQGGRFLLSVALRASPC